MHWCSALLVSLLQEGNNSFFSDPFESGFLVFLVGGLGLLMVYHLFLYFQNKDKTYLLYSAYLLFIILSQCRYIPDNSLGRAFDTLGIFKYFNVFYTEVSYILYFIFAYRFLGIKQDFPKVYGYLRRSVIGIGVYSFAHAIHFFFARDFQADLRFYHAFVIATIVLSIVSYVFFFKSKTPSKYYLIIGSLILLFFSIASFVSFGIEVSNGQSGKASYSILYVGFMLENILFSLGLGKKQKLIIEQRNKAQQALIQQLKQNERLEAQYKARQEEEIHRLTKQLEEDAKERLTVHYQKQMAELKLASLRSQMNPHFIFNSLNSIKGFIIDKNQDDALFYLNKFSKLVRKILSSSIEKEISLAEEIEIAQLYLQLENIRFNNAIEFELHVDPALAPHTIQVPALIFQPFLENAIWHGLSAKKGDKSILLAISKRADQMVVIIEDNGIGRKQAEALKKRKLSRKESYGLQLTEDRLKSFVESHQGSYELKFEDLMENYEAKGTRVTILLSIQYASGTSEF